MLDGPVSSELRESEVMISETPRLNTSEKIKSGEKREIPLSTLPSNEWADWIRKGLSKQPERVRNLIDESTVLVRDLRLGEKVGLADQLEEDLLIYGRAEGKASRRQAELEREGERPQHTHWLGYFAGHEDVPDYEWEPAETTRELNSIAQNALDEVKRRTNLKRAISIYRAGDFPTTKKELEEWARTTKTIIRNDTEEGARRVVEQETVEKIKTEVNSRNVEEERLRKEKSLIGRIREKLSNYSGTKQLPEAKNS